jgi:DNA-binding CsgD family transcriptional regulator
VASEALAAARDPKVRAQAMAVVGGWTGTVDAELAVAMARDAVAALEQSRAEPAALSFGLANLVRAELFVGNGFERKQAERAQELESSAPPAAVDDRMIYRLGQWLRYVDDFEGARTHLAYAEQAALDEGDESSLVNILINQLLVELWAGDWARAAWASDRLTGVIEQLDVAWGGPVWQAYLDSYLGRLSAVRRAAEAADRSEPSVDMLYLRSLGVAELAADLNPEAYRDLRGAIELIERAGNREPAIWRVEGEAVEAAVAAGDVDWGEELTRRFERHAETSSIPWNRAVSARCRGLVLAARGDLDAAARSLEDALVAHERCPMPFEQARTLYALGRVRRRLKQKRLARLALEDALAIFDELGAAAWAERTRQELRRVTTRRAPTTLTPTEQEIARLASEGLTNAAIAERMFVAVNTVEANLRRAYRKLGITSRAQLSRALDEQASTPIS